MPKLWKFLTKEEAPAVQDYAFEAAEDLKLPGLEEEEEKPAEAVPEPEPEPVSQERDPIGYAKIQSEKIMEEARKEAEELLKTTRAMAEQQAAEAKEQAAKQGYEMGFARGEQEGNASALAKSRELQAQLEEEYSRRIEAFTKSAERALTHQMNENVEGMKDLALAVAEKVVSVSLRSSSDVIAKMIQTAVDKRRHREWVHIYIAGCDAKRMGALPPALASALGELSDHVRIIPMAQDEPGTCIVEFPDEIIDASATTQIQNIRDLLQSAGK